jgi:hypothetical protein
MLNARVFSQFCDKIFPVCNTFEMREIFVRLFFVPVFSYHFCCKLVSGAYAPRDFLVSAEFYIAKLILFRSFFTQ